MKTRKLYVVVCPFDWEADPVHYGSSGYVPVFANKRVAKKAFPGCKIIEINETTETNTKWE